MSSVETLQTRLLFGTGPPFAPYAAMLWSRCFRAAKYGYLFYCQ